MDNGFPGVIETLYFAHSRKPVEMSSVVPLSLVQDPSTRLEQRNVTGGASRILSWPRHWTKNIALESLVRLDRLLAPGNDAYACVLMIISAG
jgi:hypothetical protein